jgi:hypothetical protein
VILVVVTTFGQPLASAMTTTSETDHVFAAAAAAHRHDVRLDCCSWCRRKGTCCGDGSSHECGRQDAMTKLHGCRDCFFDVTDKLLSTQTNTTQHNTTQTKPNQTKPNQTKPHQTKPNQTKPINSACLLYLVVPYLYK